jgi:glutamate-ammonia-ligase adenylyltransferase
MPDVPSLLQAKALQWNKHFSLHSHPLSASVEQLLLISDYAALQINCLTELLQNDTCQQALDFNDYQQALRRLPLSLSQASFCQALRQFRHQHLLRLLLREIAGFSTTNQTLHEWSDCADAIILHALDFCQNQISQKHGQAMNAQGEQAFLQILAMGKLGGRELNFSSDIDLIFTYSETGQTQGPVSIDNQQFFNKVVQLFVQVLQQNTRDGFVFRVDLRLRPYGHSGPLALSHTGMETYYQEQGRDWERYAMVKARLIQTNNEPCPWFQRLIIPFVYRRYIDFGAIESLRSMKAMILHEVQLKPMLDDIKRGRGGIREIEFIVQCFQLIRGGRLPKLQQTNTLMALAVLQEERLLKPTRTLTRAYLFFRQLENALQTQQDQQTHTLPRAPLQQAQLLKAMGFEHWQDLLNHLHHYQRKVTRVFQGVLGEDKDLSQQDGFLSQLNSLWQGHIEQQMAVHLLGHLHYQQPARCYQILQEFRHAPRCRRLSQAARLRLDKFMVLLLSKLIDTHDTDKLLLAILRLLENIVGRSAYLALLTENQGILHELLHYFASSPFISQLLIQHPFLLEIFVDETVHWQAPSRYQLQENLKKQLADCADVEQRMEALRQFKLRCYLLAARAELNEISNAVIVGRFLSNVADVIIAVVLQQALQELAERDADILLLSSRFSILAYGKLGAREMNYSSDLDLVFLHTATAQEEHWITRLTQKILHMFNTRSSSGVLYTVDTRLRPSGSAGLLVSHWDAFIDYQQKKAWTWEHQALLRARVLYANAQARQTFLRLKETVLFLPRDKKTLSQEVLEMRAKIIKHNDPQTLKYREGGLLDLEFLVQFLVLAYPSPVFCRCTHTMAFLKHLQAQNILNTEQEETLQMAYRHYHHALHQEIVQGKALAYDEDETLLVRISNQFYYSA